MNPPILIRTGVATCSLIAASMTCAIAQDFPQRPVRLVAPFSAGGGADAAARLVAEKLPASFGKQVVVDNRPGASSIIGTEIVAKAPADGYTILLAINNHASMRACLPSCPITPKMISHRSPSSA